MWGCCILRKELHHSREQALQSGSSHRAPVCSLHSSPTGHPSPIPAKTEERKNRDPEVCSACSPKVNAKPTDF